MNIKIGLVLAILLIGAFSSCAKDDATENCYVCRTGAEAIDVCEENGDFVIDGETVVNDNGASLEDLIRAIEANPENDPDLEGIQCTRQ